MTDNSLMPFGKYKGKKLSELSRGYMTALHDRKIATGELLKYIINTVPELKCWYEKHPLKNGVE